jgi:hypothetical protein
MYRKATAKLERDCGAPAAQCRYYRVKEIKGVESSFYPITGPSVSLSMKQQGRKDVHMMKTIMNTKSAKGEYFYSNLILNTVLCITYVY